MRQLGKFQCPACGGTLTDATDRLTCLDCDSILAMRDGIVDLAGQGGAVHADMPRQGPDQPTPEPLPEPRFPAFERFAGERWPATLGSVLELGCGVGRLSRAILERGAVRDAVLTDPSLRNLAQCRERLERYSDALHDNTVFATYSGTEPALRDAVFDTVAGASVLHRAVDVRRLLTEAFRVLKPGGRAFFIEPNLRFHRALMHTLADVMAQLQARQQEFPPDRQKLLNVLAEGRRVLLHQGDPEFLATLEDKHLFEAEAFERMGLEIGFATAEALPTAEQRTGIGSVAALCDRLEIAKQVRNEVLTLLPSYASRYLGLLAPRDRSAVFLLWLAKGVGPQQRSFQATAFDEEKRLLEERPPDPVGGLPPQWSFGLEARPIGSGIALRLTGWCLMNADILWLRITLDGVSRQVPVWRPRPDVQQAINGAGLYPPWNAFCAGVDIDVTFENLAPMQAALALRMELVLAAGSVVSIEVPERLPLGEQIRIPG